MGIATGKRHGLHYRHGTVDENVLADVFGRHGYSLHDIPLQPAPDRPLIVDAGAHIGCASRWFADQTPEALVIALEPEVENFTLLQRNTDGIEGIHKNNAAVGPLAGWCRVVDPGLGNWGYRTTPGHEVRVVPLNMIVLRAVDRNPWIVKIDIEGGEADLFTANTEWIDAVPVIMIELHDWLIPGSGDAWRAAMEGRGRVEFQRGETTVSVRGDWLA